MNRKNLFSLLVLDVIVMAMACGLIYSRYTALTRLHSTVSKPLPPPVTSPNKKEAASPQPAHDTAKPVDPEESQEPPEAVSAEQLRNIGFSFRHSKARHVQIIGDFNDWIPQALDKGDNFMWRITLQLQPGEYAYNYVVDGKPVRDPNNPRVCDAGRGFPNSYLKVKPRTDEN